MKSILFLVSTLSFFQSLCITAMEPAGIQSLDHSKAFRETGELPSFKVLKEVIVTIENRSPYADKDYKNAFAIIKDFEKLDKLTYDKKYKKKERENIYEIIRILLCNFKESMVPFDHRDGTRLEIPTPLLWDETLKEGWHQTFNRIIRSNERGNCIHNISVNPFKVQACEKKIRKLLPGAHISYGEVKFKSTINLDNIIPIKEDSFRIKTDNSVLHTHDLSGCSVITLHASCAHLNMNPPLSHIGIMAHVSPAYQSEANKFVQLITDAALTDFGVNLADLNLTVYIISGHISDSLYNYCLAFKNAGLTPQYVYHGLSFFENGEKKQHKGEWLNQFNYCYYHGHVDKDGEFVESELEGGKAQYHQTYYPRAVTFDVQSGEVSTLAVKDKNAKLVS